MNNFEDVYTFEIDLHNGVVLEICTKAKRLIGIRTVKYKGKSLRSNEESILPEFATPDGMMLDFLEYLGIDNIDNTIIIKTKPWFRVAHRMEWSEHAVHLRVNTSSWSTGSTTEEGSYFNIIIKQENENYDGVAYTGFSYSFEYYCPKYAIYQIEDKATWELGGTVIDNTFIMRGGNFPVVAKMDMESDYFTGWNMPGIANPHVFQHMPLYSGLSGFTFQYDNEDILLTVHEKPSHIRSLFLKQKGDHMLLHFNQFCFNLTDRVATPARKILIAKNLGGNSNTIINHYLRVRDTIHRNIREYYNIKLDTTRPSSHVETWQIADVEQFKPIFEQLNEWGIKRAFIMPLWKSNETEIVPKFEGNKHKFGFMGNMCCPLELEIAECYGGWEGLREKVLKAAVDLGIDTYMWFGSHFSSLSPLGEKIKDLFAKDLSGQNNHNNYGHVLFAVNQNSKEYQEYLISAYKKAKECGLTGVFRDSHFNMATDTINYLHISYEEEQAGTTMDQIGFLKKREKQNQDMVLSMHDTEAHIQSRFQNELEMLYYVESGGLIGTPMCGTNYEHVRGYEFIFSDMETGLNLDRIKEFGDDVDMVYFKGLSTRLIYQINIDVNKFPAKDAVDDWWNPETMAPMAIAFSKVEPYMKTMWVLEDGNGILWDDEAGNRVIFAYKDISYDVSDCSSINEVIEDCMIASWTKVEMKKMHIYHISS